MSDYRSARNADTPLPRDGGATLSSRIAGEIRDSFFTRRLSAGDYVGTEASIAEGFGVSRMAARDAIRALTAQGVVVVRKGAGGGVWIADADPERFADALAIQLRLLGVRLSDLIDAQIAAEAATAELAARRAQPADVATLRQILEQGAGLVGDNTAFTQTMFQFHVALADVARNIVLATFLKGVLRVLLDTYDRNTTIERAQMVLQSYTWVVDAVEAGDPEVARVLMRRQLQRAQSELTVAGVLTDDTGVPASDGKAGRNCSPTPSSSGPGRR